VSSHATWIGCAASNFRRGRGPDGKVEAIVVHIIVGSLASADGTFSTPDLALPRSAHYGVGKDGTVHQYVSEEDTAFHAGIVDRPTAPLVVRKLPVNPNHYTVGIEHEGKPDDLWPEAQLEASAQLIGEVAGRWNVPLDREHIIMHREIRASKTCPGFGLDVDHLVARASGKGTGTAATASTRVTDGFPRSVTVLRRVNLRAGSPTLTAPIVSVLPVGSQVVAAALVEGEAPAQGSTWWCEVGGGTGFVWARATDVVPPT
jgi:N-acetylmuramoyl-L-alanine amidase